MQNAGNILKKDVLSREIRMESIGHLVNNLDRLSKIMKINDLKNNRHIEEIADDSITMEKTVRVSRMALSGQKIGWLYRETPVNGNDSGWRMHHGEEGDDFLEDASNFKRITVAELLIKEVMMEDLVQAPIGTQFEWFDEFHKFVEID